MIKYDAIIIGFGKGGKTLAADLAKRGETVAIVEQSEKMYGETCINIGCIPTDSTRGQGYCSCCSGGDGEKRYHLPL